MDLYAEVRLLAGSLKKNGMLKEAEAILDSLQEGSTATEILMIIRHKIQTLKCDEPIVDLEVLRRSKLIVEEIDRVCK